MRTIQSFILAFAFIFTTAAVNAQTTKETIPVSGECGMCKSSIEKAAKKAGATYASWNEDSKMLDVTYNKKTSNTAKIEKAIAAVGYDTKNVTATDEAYNKLHGCCKYERKNAATKADCCADCKDEACKKACAEGTCTMEKCKHDKKDASAGHHDHASSNDAKAGSHSCSGKCGAKS